jgi:hypothetical protein
LVGLGETPVDVYLARYQQHQCMQASMQRNVYHYRQFNGEVDGERILWTGAFHIVNTTDSTQTLFLKLLRR